MYVSPVASMAFRHGQESLSRVVDELDRILDRYRGRLLVHSQTFAIARDVVARSRHGGRFELYEGGGRDGAVERYKAGADRVLIGPSVKRGVDLPNGLCDAVVILVGPKEDWGANCRVCPLRSDGSLYDRALARLPELLVECDAIRRQAQSEADPGRSGFDGTVTPSGRKRRCPRCQREEGDVEFRAHCTPYRGARAREGAKGAARPGSEIPARVRAQGAQAVPRARKRCS